MPTLKAEIKWFDDGWHGFVDGKEYICYGISEIVDMIEDGRAFVWAVKDNKFIGKYTYPDPKLTDPYYTQPSQLKFNVKVAENQPSRKARIWNYLKHKYNRIRSLLATW